jgi:hypothetical protein
MEETIYETILYLLLLSGITLIIAPLLKNYLESIMKDRRKIEDEEIYEIVNILEELQNASIETVGFSIQILKKEGALATDYKEPEKIGYALKRLKKPYHTHLKAWNHLNHLIEEINIGYQSLKNVISTKISTKNKEHRKKILNATRYLSDILLEEPIENIHPDKVSRTKHMGNFQIRYNGKVVDSFRPDLFETYKIEKFLTEIITDADVKKKLKIIKEKRGKIDTRFQNFKNNLRELLSLSKNKLKKKIILCLL